MANPRQEQYLFPLLPTFLAIGMTLAFWPTAVWLVERWTTSVWQDAHGLFVLPVVTWFSYVELRRFKGVPSDPNPIGFLFVAASLALNALDAGVQTMMLSALGFVLLLPGLALLLLGTERTRAIIFPLAFSAFMLPIPLRFTESIHLVLRHIAAVGSEWLLSSLGISTFLDGLTLHLPRGAMFIADSCSGFSTLYAALAVACLTAHSATSTTRKALVLLLTVPIAIAANILRVTLLGLLVQWRGSEALSTWLHPASGVMTFLVALPLIFWIGQSRSIDERPATS